VRRNQAATVVQARPGTKYPAKGITKVFNACYLALNINTVLVRLFICALMLGAFAANAQHLDPLPASLSKDSLDKMVARTQQVKDNLDSLQAHQLEKLRSQQAADDSINLARNMDEYVRMQKEHDAQVKKQLWIKGSLFGVMLVVTVTGFVRRKRQKVKG